MSTIAPARTAVPATTGAFGLRVIAHQALTEYAARPFGVQLTPVDPAIFETVPALLALVAAFAGYVPAHRAARLDPVAAIRTE